MKTKPYKIITIAVFALILIIIPVLTFINLPGEERAFSENENRYLAVFPKISFETYLNKKAMTGFEDWFSDHVFGREECIQIKNSAERLLGKSQINGVYTYNDQMMQAWEGFDAEFIDKNLSAINKFAEKYPDIPTYFLLAPTSQEIYSSLIPKSAPIGSQSELYNYCREKLECNTVDVFHALKSSSDDYIYYRTDHHWTSYGAYIAYTEAAKAMGLQSEPLSSFNIEHASSSFRGTLYSKTLDSGVTPDMIDYYHFNGGASPIKLEINSGTEITEYDSLYFREYLDVKDKYSSFMGPNSPMMTITSGSNDTNGQSLLIFKDSYAHAFIPFLVNHYSKITVFDMRLMNYPYSKFVNVEDYDSVLILYNAITFSEDNGIRKLSMGK